MEASTYELIRRRLNTQATDLRQRLDGLNQLRKATFGAVETQLIATDRITTSNNCIPSDMVAVGDRFLFGYNVHVGLRSEMKLADVFAVYRYDNQSHSFHEESLDLLSDPKFEEEFHNLYKYYKDTVFARFALRGPHLFLVFQVGKSATEVKTFKWALNDGQLHYLGNRFDHEYQFPKQHEFAWQKVGRDQHRRGLHPHVSILDRVFVETIGGDLTVKVEDNTDSGLGIYAEPVEYPDQTLDDAEYHFADLGNIILLKIRPYQEKVTRYFIFNQKLQQVLRVDSLSESCVLLPDDQGILFSNGFYLQSGEHKIFDQAYAGLRFEKKIISPNGEDFLYVFHQPATGQYVLLLYNLVNMTVESPIHCGGFLIFANGELCYFRAEEQPGRHHVIQIWQTPYGSSLQFSGSEGWLAKVGNKDLVRGMAECNELLTLLSKDDSYADLYVDLVKKTGDIVDSYFWIGKEEAGNLAEPLKAIRETAGSAIDEYEKVRAIRENTRTQTAAAQAATDALLGKIRRHKPRQIMEFVGYLGELRQVRGQIIGLRELRYADEPTIASLEAEVVAQVAQLGEGTVAFLLGPDALAPYVENVKTIEGRISSVTKVTQANEVSEAIDSSSGQLELLIEVIGSLAIEDATQTTSIIERISEIFSRLNGLRAALKSRRKELLGTEAKAEFFAQLKLLDQALVNYLDLSDTPAKAEDYLTRLMVQVEELEGKFVEFEEFTLTLSEKREELFNAFETRRLQLIEARSRRANALLTAADRILSGIQNRASQLKDPNEVNAWFASDMMVGKVRGIIEDLGELGDPVKAGDVQTRLKSAREEVIRQLRDRKDLFVEGANVMKMGRHAFAVNRQNLDLTLVPRGEDMFFHISGTNYFEKITDPAFLDTKSVWDMTMVSEDRSCYRAEYLAWRFLQEHGLLPDSGDPLSAVQAFAASRYHEGYSKGVHDADAAAIVAAWQRMERSLGLLRFGPATRAFAQLCWKGLLEDSHKTKLTKRISSAAHVMKAFPQALRFGELIAAIQEAMRPHAEGLSWVSEAVVREAAAYLLEEMKQHDDFIASGPASALCKAFSTYLSRQKKENVFRDSLDAVKEDPMVRFEVIGEWLSAFEQQQSQVVTKEYHLEACALLFQGFSEKRIWAAEATTMLSGMKGEHAVIGEGGTYQLDYHGFSQKMKTYEATVVPLFEQMTSMKHELLDRERRLLRLEEFQPRVMTSFVRNKLIDQLYLPLVGDNLAKQLGTVGENTRTDRQGLLLLISPPGYGKTTLMEYVANRLGLIFMKVNGPAIGHQVTSLDPAEAGNAGAREELHKLNLALEMGDNVMLYLDDIQHCHPEFLQKFISLTDAQRKIEGVYKGVSRTYDLRGKKIAVVMAGNPYTESGDKFRIPDMLANRADTYNLGDIIGGSEDLFKLSYVENALTANPVVARLAQASMKDIHAVIRAAELNEEDSLELESNVSREELSEIISVLKKMMVIRDVVLKVNKGYITSAAQQDEYRKEPPFLLQGSYRNMARMSEKLSPIMNESELETVILSHYEGEAQTLATGAEANFLAFRQLIGKANEQETARRKEIVGMYLEQKRVSMDRLGQLVEEMRTFSEGLLSIRDVLKKEGEGGK
ncbi:MAG: DNA repair ATPase [Bacteroidia bacterium]|nr:DNA repair ATPase [Bacteroidia bacterium]